MSDILLSMPQHWSEKGEVVWVMTNYWMHDDGTFTEDFYGDGDHEEIEYEDIPTWNEAQKRFDAYYLYCIDTGEDPLFEFMVRRTKRTLQRWQVYFVRSIAGLCIQRVRRAGRLYTINELPKAIREYLLVQDNGSSHNTRADYDDLENAGIKLNRWETIRIDGHEPRKASAIAREIRFKARKAYNMRCGRNRLSHRSAA